jgi:serine/threonine protein kinase
VDSVEEEVNQELKTLMDEVYLLGSMSHPNIMRFCAVCLDPPMIVTQYYPHGSLFDLLKKGRRGEKRAVQVSRVQG